MSLVGGLSHGLAMPGSGLPFSEWLVFVGLALFAELILGADARLRYAWLFGVAHFAVSSASLRHPLLPGYLIILSVGSLYFVGIAACLRYAQRRHGRTRALLLLPLLWSLYETLKAQMPQLQYPHAQSAHALFEYPQLLGPVRFFGESGMNLLLAGVAVGLWALLRAERRMALTLLASSVLLWGLGVLLPSKTMLVEGAQSPHVALVQTGRPSYRDQAGGEQFFNEEQPNAAIRWLVGQYRRLGPEIDAEGEPDLVVWPESTFGFAVDHDRMAADVRILAYLLPPAAHTLFGALYTLPPKKKGEQRPQRIAAFYADRDGRLLGRHEKQILVPGGEFVPLIPSGSGLWLRQAIAKALDGATPDASAGEEQELLRLGERSFAAAICFENAFPQVFAKAALRGAEFFVVLSHEGWYRGGSELDQLLASSVFRTLECGRPLLRSTTDGLTAWIGADGRIRDRLPLGQAGVLHTRPQPHRGERMAMRWALRLPWFLAVAALILLLGSFCRERRPAPAFRGYTPSRPKGARLS